GIRGKLVTGVQTCALPIYTRRVRPMVTEHLDDLVVPEHVDPGFVDLDVVGQRPLERHRGLTSRCGQEGVRVVGDTELDGVGDREDRKSVVKGTGRRRAGVW